MRTFQVLLVLFAACVPLAALAQRFRLPLAVPLILGGMALALVPGIPKVELDPELMLALFLPPLLQRGAYRTDWSAFRDNLRPILLLAIGAVFFSAATVACVARWVAPELPWWAAIALGAIVAPPDAVAASSVLARFNLPKRLSVVLEGESLINDASSLVLYRFAVGAVAAGSVSYLGGAWQFASSALGGAAVGWVAARVAMWLFAKLDDTMHDIAVSLLSGYGAFFAAEALHVSGVLAVVVCGLLLSRRQHTEFTARTRLELQAVWNFVSFLLEALVFMLIGLQLRDLVERLQSEGPGHLATVVLSVSATLIASRFAWIYLGAAAVRLLPGDRAEPMPARHLAVLSWAGMRGVVSLAAALALPADFPGRDLIVLLAFTSILATLVVQGTTLGWVVERLDIAEPDKPTPLEGTAEVRAGMAEAALQAVRSTVDATPEDRLPPDARTVVEEFETRAARAGDRREASASEADGEAESQRLRLVAIQAARDRLATSNEALEAEQHRLLIEELDLEERRIRKALGDD